MKLSIIIPYYNTENYTKELLDCLALQIGRKRGIECILVDDGSDEPFETNYKWCKVTRTEHLGQSHARNVGLDKAKGEYVQFIDSDDMVAENFIASILAKIKENPDIIEFSWKSLNPTGPQFNFKLNSETDRLPNPSVCTRTFKKDYIGARRFNENKDATEDEDFSRRVGYSYNTMALLYSVITDYMYFYRTDVPRSNVKEYKSGLKKTKRVVYFFNQVTADRSDILESIKKDDEENEVILMTNRLELAELRRYCQIMKPSNIWTHYLKGETYSGCQIIPVPIESQVIIYISTMNKIGGLESFIYNFASVMKDEYDITLLVGSISSEQRRRIEKHIRVVNYSASGSYRCDTLIMVRILDKVPFNVTYNKYIQMCHACKTNPNWHINQDADYIVNVSEASKESFGDEAKDAIVIHNPIEKNEKKALILVSATRIPAIDKGNNEKRMVQLADMLNKAGIPYVWLNFSDGNLDYGPMGLVNMGTFMDIQPYIARADYLVQLSDNEAYSYSVLEALANNTAVIVTPFASVEESGVVDGKNGYIIPFDMNFDVNKLLKVPKVKSDISNDEIIEQWKEIIGESNPRNHYQMDDSGVLVRVLINYQDLEMHQLVHTGEFYYMRPERAEALVRKGFVAYAE